MTAPTDATSLAAQVPTSEVLYRAADEVAARGLGYGVKTWDPAGTGPICTEGAIAAAAGIPLVVESGMASPAPDALLSCPAYIAVHEYLHLPKKSDLWRWNDECDKRGQHVRTAEEVIEVLRAAAVIAAAKEAPTVAREKVAEGAGAVAS